MAREEDCSDVLRRIEDGTTSRRAFLGTAAAAAAFSAVSFRERFASAIESPSNLAASPPTGFVPFAAPGRIVKVTKAGCLQANQIYPKPDDAKAMLTRAMTELTGKADLVAATKEFVSPGDVVCVKVNGIAEHNMGTNKELVLPFLDAMIAAGVKPENITVLEQYGSFLAGTRVNDSNVPAGVKTSVHQNKDATMDERMIPGTGVKTKFVRVLTESTAVINFSLIKDHSICGYTGMLKNMTHGCQILPHYFHQHHASPQIALLYAQDVIKSRVRLCITDGFKLMYNGGPKWTEPRFVVPHESVYVTTDAVAMDALGAELVDKARQDKGLPTLAAAGRPPAYIKAAGDLGLGVADRSAIQLSEVTL
jgi:uncharacterized protein (DUF362 family)